jgi:hypothetical protein
MVVILVHWLIQQGKEEDFKNRWQQMTIKHGSGLYREILTETGQRALEPEIPYLQLGRSVLLNFHQCRHVGKR